MGKTLPLHASPDDVCRPRKTATLLASSPQEADAALDSSPETGWRAAAGGLVVNDYFGACAGRAVGIAVPAQDFQRSQRLCAVPIGLD